MKKILLVISLCCILNNVFGQKVKNDSENHQIKSYPVVSLPPDVFTYKVDVVISDGSTLSDYYQSPSVLRNDFFKMNYFTYDSLKGRLQFELFMEAKPYAKSYTSMVDQFGRNVYTPVVSSRFSGKLAVYLDGKMIDYKIIDFTRSPAVLVNPKPNETYIGYTPPTPLPTIPADAIAQLGSYTDAYYEKEASSVNGYQIRKLYELMSSYLKNTFDVKYGSIKSTFYKVKTKEGEYIRQDTTYEKALAAVKGINPTNYSNSLIKLKAYQQVWKEEKIKFNSTLPTEVPFVWAMSMNLATVSAILEDYKVAFENLKEADDIGLDRKESSALKKSIQDRANIYYTKYDENGLSKNIELVYLNRMTPDEVNEIREKRQKEIEDSLYTVELKKDAEKYRYAIRNQQGTILTKDGLIYNGLISFNPDLYPPGPVGLTQGTTIYNNCVIFEYKNEKGKDRMDVYNTSKLKGFSVNGKKFESVSCYSDLLGGATYFYQIIYRSAYITLYEYQNHRIHFYAMKAAGDDKAYNTDFGDFAKDPNLVWKQLFKANPDFVNRMQGISLPKDSREALQKVCEDFTMSFKK